MELTTDEVRRSTGGRRGVVLDEAAEALRAWGLPGRSRTRAGVSGVEAVNPNEFARRGRRVEPPERGSRAQKEALLRLLVDQVSEGAAQLYVGGLVETGEVTRGLTVRERVQLALTREINEIGILDRFDGWSDESVVEEVLKRAGITPTPATLPRILATNEAVAPVVNAVIAELSYPWPSRTLTPFTINSLVASIARKGRGSGRSIPADKIRVVTTSVWDDFQDGRLTTTDGLDERVLKAWQDWDNRYPWDDMAENPEDDGAALAEYMGVPALDVNGNVSGRVMQMRDIIPDNGEALTEDARRLLRSIGGTQQGTTLLPRYTAEAEGWRQFTTDAGKASRLAEANKRSMGPLVLPGDDPAVRLVANGQARTKREMVDGFNRGLREGLTQLGLTLSEYPGIDGLAESITDELLADGRQVQNVKAAIAMVADSRAFRVTIQADILGKSTKYQVQRQIEPSLIGADDAGPVTDEFSDDQKKLSVWIAARIRDELENASLVVEAIQRRNIAISMAAELARSGRRRVQDPALAFDSNPDGSLLLVIRGTTPTPSGLVLPIVSRRTVTPQDVRRIPANEPEPERPSTGLSGLLAEQLRQELADRGQAMGINKRLTLVEGLLNPVLDEGQSVAQAAITIDDTLEDAEGFAVFLRLIRDRSNTTDRSVINWVRIDWDALDGQPGPQTFIPVSKRRGQPGASLSQPVEPTPTAAPILSTVAGPTMLQNRITLQRTPDWDNSDSVALRDQLSALIGQAFETWLGTERLQNARANLLGDLMARLPLSIGGESITSITLAVDEVTTTVVRPDGEADSTKDWLITALVQAKPRASWKVTNQQVLEFRVDEPLVTFLRDIKRANRARSDVQQDPPWQAVAAAFNQALLLQDLDTTIETRSTIVTRLAQKLANRQIDEANVSIIIRRAFQAENGWVVSITVNRSGPDSRFGDSWMDSLSIKDAGALWDSPSGILKRESERLNRVTAARVNEIRTVISLALQQRSDFNVTPDMLLSAAQQVAGQMRNPDRQYQESRATIRPSTVVPDALDVLVTSRWTNPPDSQVITVILPRGPRAWFEAPLRQWLEQGIALALGEGVPQAVVRSGLNDAAMKMFVDAINKSIAGEIQAARESRDWEKLRDVLRADVEVQRSINSPTTNIAIWLRYFISGIIMAKATAPLADAATAQLMSKDARDEVPTGMLLANAPGLTKDRQVWRSAALVRVEMALSRAFRRRFPEIFEDNPAISERQKGSARARNRTLLQKMAELLVNECWQNPDLIAAFDAGRFAYQEYEDGSSDITPASYSLKGDPTKPFFRVQTFMDEKDADLYEVILRGEQPWVGNGALGILWIKRTNQKRGPKFVIQA